jgi:hypothetical protein
MNLKNIVLTAIFVFAVFASVTYTACTKDDCEDVICQNNGICQDGKCQCPSGYAGENCETVTDPCVLVQCKNEGVCKDGKCQCPFGFEGELCEVLSINKYFGAWKGTDSCSSGDYESNIALGSSPASNKSARITNPGGFGDAFAVTGELTDVNTLTIPLQNVAPGFTLSGKVVFEGSNKMIFSYIKTTTVSKDTCTGMYTK